MKFSNINGCTYLVIVLSIKTEQKGKEMFKVYEMVETYESGIENLGESAIIECATYEDAMQEYEQRVNTHIEAGHQEIFKCETAANFANFNGGKYAVASYSIIVR